MSTSFNFFRPQRARPPDEPELDQRRAAADANPDAAIPWEVIKSKY
jgi:hypothetical protein